MAITNAQQYKQLLAKGGRIGLKGGADASMADFDAPAAAREGREAIGRTGPGPNVSAGGASFNDLDPSPSGKAYDTNKKDFELGVGVSDLEKLKKDGVKDFNFPFPYVGTLLNNNFVKDLRNKGLKKNIAYFEGLKQRGKLSNYPPTLQGYKDYMKDRLGGNITATGNEIQQGGDNFFANGIASLTPTNTDINTDAEIEEDEIVNYRLMADGGRAAFAGGGKDAGAGSNFGNENFGNSGDGRPNMADIAGPVTTSSPGGNKGNEPPTNVSGNNQKTPVVVNPIKNLSTHFNNNQKLKDAVALGLITNEEYNTLGGYDVKQTLGMGPIDTGLASLGYNVVQSFKGDQKFSDIFGDVSRNVKGATNISPDLQAKYENIMQMADGGRAGFAEGGMPYEGGIMDLESSRQMYGLGKLVKKITRSVKKIAKSPIGKAALAFGAYKLGGAFLKNKGIMGSIFGQAGSRVGQSFVPFKEGFLPSLGLTKGGGSFMPTALGGIAASTLGSYFLTPKEGDDDDDKEFYAGADIADPKYIMNNPELFTNRRLAAEGGSMDEPVAKKTMPLLDMDGQEMDLREEGGFVPLGRMERADDVPARLSKNEFVFTADAVRNAGEGDVDKGAEVMYNMMKNLESGGDVSEESQGLEGAREMFQTSQRLEEVI